jgi:hypothetical protein
MSNAVIRPLQPETPIFREERNNTRATTGETMSKGRQGDKENATRLCRGRAALSRSKEFKS